MSVDIILPSLAKSSFSSMREFDEEHVAEVVVTTDGPGLENEHTDMGCVKLFSANSDIEDVVVESVETTTVSGVEEIEDDSSVDVDETINVPRLEDSDTDIGCVSLFGTNSDIEDVVVDSVDATNVSRVEGLITALVGCVVLPGTTVEFVESDDTDISCETSVDAEVEVEEILLVDLTSLSLHGVDDDSSEGVEEPQLVLYFFLGLDSPCRG